MINVVMYTTLQNYFTNGEKNIKIYIYLLMYNFV